MTRIYKSAFFISLFILTAMAASPLKAQSEGLRIVGDVRVSMLVDKHIEMNERLNSIQGYRIQVASLSGTDSKNKAFALRDRLRESYPNVPAYVVFDEPNFKVKLGDFRTRLEAYAFLNEIKSIYPGTIIRDNVYALPLVIEDALPETDDGI
ncbi:MAG: SPOR domain-containing protein [Bacteroidales bacterium]|nr:SPOR domain-containing protein [Bacteroidales bacterium]